MGIELRPKGETKWKQSFTKDRIELYGVLSKDYIICIILYYGVPNKNSHESGKRIQQRNKQNKR